ncbi:hypothetical protein QJS10_CPA10g00987 [Acorus calamus]|uniref:MYB transcription factor n=1 Tax=Acorus calamus TaxID=4465 RepID=A0AAV9E1Z1_ACOCL|nr:hypothetical protein QJS10_CPA10g00987 [Acorus calamus]
MVEVMRKSFSMENLASATATAGGGGGGETMAADHGHGYLSDGPVHDSRRGRSNQRKRGIPWTEEEHRTFLMGLKKLGKGDWRGISKNFVPTRTPTQVASHAQKYFLRQTSSAKKKRRSSLFDVVINDDDTPTSESISAKINEVNLHSHINHLVKASESSSNLPLEIPGIKVPDLPKIKFTANQVADTISPKLHIGPTNCVPGFLNLSLKAPSQPDRQCSSQHVEIPTAMANNNDLELRIAPPRPFRLNRISTEASIRVV